MADTQLDSLLMKLTDIGRILDRIPLNFALEIRKVGKEILAESRILERLASLEAVVNLQSSGRVPGGR